MFVLPIEARWLGLIDGLLLAHGLLFGTRSDRILILCAMASFSVLFGNVFITMVHNYFRRKKFKREVLQGQSQHWDDEDEDDEDYDDEDEDDY